MEAENPEPDKLQPRVSAAIYSGWLSAAVGSNCLSTSNVLTCIAVSIPHTACEAPIGSEVAVVFSGMPGCFCSHMFRTGAPIDNCDTAIVTAAFPYAKREAYKTVVTTVP